MEITIKKKDFLKGLHRTQGIVEKRHTMPILSNVLLSTVGKKIEISATDLDIGVKDLREADVIKEGSIIVNARKLYEIIREMPGDIVEVKTKENNWLELRSGKALFNIVALSPEEFPSIPSPEIETLYKIPSLIFKDMIDMTIFAASDDTSIRYNMNGIYLETDTEDDMLRMVATNGHRLAIISKKNTGVSGLDDGIIIPKKGLGEVKRLIDDEHEEEIQIGLFKNSLIVKTDKTDLTIRLLEGDFPDYKDAIPEDNEQIVKVDKGQLLSILKRMVIISSDKYKGLKVILNSGNLEVITSNPDLGEAREDIDVDYSGENIEIIFNARYFIDGLSALVDESEIILELKNSASAGMIRPVKREDYVYIMMPMRL
ncbi:MAG: DNA polymerase III subunit beta [Thermodesulfobacteriota bacterium]